MQEVKNMRDYLDSPELGKEQVSFWLVSITKKPWWWPSVEDYCVTVYSEKKLQRFLVPSITDTMLLLHYCKNRLLGYGPFDRNYTYDHEPIRKALFNAFGVQFGDVPITKLRGVRLRY